MRSCNLDKHTDNDVDADDFALLEGCWSDPGLTPAAGCESKDLDRDNDVDGQDYALFQPCMSGDGNPAPAECQGLPPFGSFTLHGLTLDVLSDGHALLSVRARTYDPKHGRWLQRDPLGYVDGPNLYEAFGGNPLVNVDPDGRGIITFLYGVGYELSDWQFFKDTLWTAGGIAQDTKDDLCHGLVYTLGGSRCPSKRQQRLINLVNAEARYSGRTDPARPCWRATVMHLSDNVGATSFNTMANAEIFVFTKTGEAYVKEASFLERAQGGVDTVGQGAGTAALVSCP